MQAAFNSRLRLSAGMTFFDDESGDEEMQIEPYDFNNIVGLVDKRGWPEFSKAANFTGAWRGMVSKHLFNGLAFRSPLHPRAPRNLRARPPRALRSVGLDSGTLDTP